MAAALPHRRRARHHATSSRWPGHLRHAVAGRVLGMDSHSGYRNNRADGPAALGRSERRRRHRPVRRGGEMARAHLCPLRGLLRIRPRPPHHRLAEGLPALPRPGPRTAVRARAHLGPPSAAGPRADRPGRHSPRPIRNPFPGRGDTAAGRRRTLALAAQPAHRAIPGRLPERPEGQGHVALGPAAPRPPAYPRHSLTGRIGVANVFDDVGVYSSLQQVIPPRLMGRALGVRRGVLLLSMGLGSAVTPLLIDAWGPRGTLIATGTLLVVTAAVFVPRLRVLPPASLRDSRASGQRAGVGDLRARRRDHPRRGARRALLHDRGGPYPRRQGRHATP